MSPSRGGGKRKRSVSPARARSPEAKKGKLDSLLSFLTPGKAKPDAEKKKKRLSFGAPVVHAFDAFSPPCRRRALYDNANMDASKMEKESLQVEIGCRQEEEDVAVDIDIKTASQKSLAKVVNQLWNQDQLKELQEWGVFNKSDSKLSRSELASKILVLHGLERKASVLMSGEHSVLPAHMDIDELKEELRSRRIGTHGEREVLERRLEEAWIKEGSRFDMQGEDGYAFGRHAVSAKNLVEEMTEEQVKDELAKPQWGLKKKDIPKKHHERMLMLESLYSDELQRRKEVAFNIALNDMLASYQLKCSGPKAQLFQRLTQHLKSIAEARGGESSGGSSNGTKYSRAEELNPVLLQHQTGTRLIRMHQQRISSKETKDLKLSVMH